MAMPEKLGFDGQVKELQIGKTFKGCRDSSFHTIRYDFKPASVDSQRAGSLKVENKEVTLSVPHLEGIGEVVFKGNKIPTSKDCLLIIDHTTGEIVLEKVSQNVRVKKTRSESNAKKIPPRPPQVDSKSHNKISPSHSTQSPNVNRPSTPKSPVQKSNNVAGNVSMPMLSFDDNKMSDSSSDSDSNSGSSSSSDSDSDSDDQTSKPTTNQYNGNDRSQPVSQLLASVVHGDLELSEED